MDVDILAVPYDSGQEDARLGRGPGHVRYFVDAGLCFP
jgi:hypothetical protein